MNLETETCHVIKKKWLTYAVSLMHYRAVGQLMLEIHTYALERRNNFEDFAAWWRQLEAAGLRAYSSELNYPSYAWLEEPMAIEMNWINNCLGEKACGTLVRDVPDRAVDGLGPPRSARSY